MAALQKHESETADGTIAQPQTQSQKKDLHSLYALAGDHSPSLELTPFKRTHLQCENNSRKSQDMYVREMKQNAEGKTLFFFFLL